MTRIAQGPFEVKLAPQPLSERAAGTTLGRISIDKQFHGDLEATSRGEMLSARGMLPGSAGYVALEQVTGTLHGQAGGFALQHSGTMDRGVPSLVVGVVPDTGSGELEGISGRMEIIVEGGRHSYRFEYEIPPKA